MSTDTMTLAQYRDTWTEEQFQQAVINLAHANGWLVAHFRPVKQQRRDGSVRYLTPVQADGKGFPDLVCAKEGFDTVFLELKSKSGRFSWEQRRWLEVLGEGWYAHGFKPADWDAIEAVLT